MEQSIFRKSSLDRVSSPEQLNDYIKVTTPGVWMTLTAVIVLLVGVCVWGVLGRLDTKIAAPLEVESGEALVYLPADRAAQMGSEAFVDIDGEEYLLGKPVGNPVRLTEAAHADLLFRDGLQAGSWAQPYRVQADLPDGVYQVEVILERIAPMSFVLN